MMVKIKSEINCCLVLFSQSLPLLTFPNREGEGAHSRLTTGHPVLQVAFPPSSCHLPQGCARGADEKRCCVKRSSLLVCCRKTAARPVLYRPARTWYFQTFIYLLGYIYMIILIRYLFCFSLLSNPIFKFTKRDSGM